MSSPAQRLHDHPFDAPLEHALNIDFANEAQGPGGGGTQGGVSAQPGGDDPCGAGAG